MTLAFFAVVVLKTLGTVLMVMSIMEHGVLAGRKAEDTITLVLSLAVIVGIWCPL